MQPDGLTTGRVSMGCCESCRDGLLLAAGVKRLAEPSPKAQCVVNGTTSVFLLIVVMLVDLDEDYCKANTNHSTAQ
jgi:hypothetical protein